jgi:hypothetical protein
MHAPISLSTGVKVAVKLGNMETAAVQIANAVNQIQ